MSDNDQSTLDVPLDGPDNHGVDDYAAENEVIPETQGETDTAERGRGSALKDVNETPVSAERSNERSFQGEEELELVADAREEQRDLGQEPGEEYRTKGESVTAWVNGRTASHNLTPRYSQPQVPSYEGKVTKDQDRPRHERKVGEGK